ncbi:hypothetical protein [Streptomyces hokutonensis]|uniref:Uncharacterized protein n=1 Tax=Streptomyces hokutonensis TaxID=1306990 RepID=A0ABW6MEL3_9ACTN
MPGRPLMPESAPRLYIGNAVTYTGPFTEMHDRPLAVLHCNSMGSCEACREWTLNNEGADREHFLVADPTSGRYVRHADRASLSLIPHEWPEDTVPFSINGYWYAAAYATAGGSERTRTVHFYTAHDVMGRTWCHFPEITPEIRRLDEQGRRRPV